MMSTEADHLSRLVSRLDYLDEMDKTHGAHFSRHRERLAIRWALDTLVRLDPSLARDLDDGRTLAEHRRGNRDFRRGA